MKLLCGILFTLLFLNASCSDSARDSATLLSKNPQDSVFIYLDLANTDTILTSKKLQYNKRAFQLLTKANNDSLNRVDLFKAANRFYNLGDYENYKGVSRFVLRRSELDRDTTGIAKAYTYLGDYFYRKSSKDSAFYYFIKAEKLYKLLGDNNNLATINVSKGTVLWLEGDFFGSESATLDALKYLRFNQNNRKSYEAFTLLGLISKELNNYDKALEYQSKALSVVRSTLINDPEHPLSITLNNMGNIYQSMGNNVRAIKNFEEALSDKSLIKDNPKVFAIILDNLAYSKFKIDRNDPEISPLFKRALAVHDSLGEKSLAIFSKVRYSEYIYSVGDTLVAITMSKEALKEAKYNRNANDMLAPLRQLSNFVPDSASFYSREYIKITDSLQQAERKSKDKFARIQFETEEISLQKDKLEEQNRNLLLFFVGTVMIGLLLFVIRTQRAKNRELMHKQAQQKANEDIYNLMLSQQNKIEEGRIQEKKRIAQELHDGVLGRLFGARLNLDSLNKQGGELAEEKRNNYLSELKNIEQDIREISHDLNREKFVLINNFIAILNNLLEEQSASFGAEVSVNIDQDIKWDRVSNALKINLYRIVQEALQNINKYANATKIDISLNQNAGQILLSITDNGVGFAVDKKSKGIGLQNMVSRVAECEGIFDIKSRKGKGTTITIEFPIENKSITA